MMIVVFSLPRGVGKMLLSLSLSVDSLAPSRASDCSSPPESRDRNLINIVQKSQPLRTQSKQKTMKNISHIKLITESKQTEDFNDSLENTIPELDTEDK